MGVVCEQTDLKEESMAARRIAVTLAALVLTPLVFAALILGGVVLADLASLLVR